MHDSHPHLDAPTLQALLDGELSREAVRAVREHVAGCGSCRTQFESWQTVFECLDGMEYVHAPFGFADRVMTRWQESAVEVQVAGELSPALAAGVPSTGHPSGDLILGLLDGALPHEQSERIQSHLAACQTCEQERRTWSGLVAQLDGLGHVNPPPGFAARTMRAAGVKRQVRRSRRMVVGLRAARIARRVLPATRKGWAAVAGLATAPATVAAAVIWVVFSNPLVTPSALFSFLGWKLGDGLGAVGSTALDLAGQSLAAFQAFQVVDFLTSSPALAALSALAFTAMTASAAWVLYRNLFSNQRLHYARASI